MFTIKFKINIVVDPRLFQDFGGQFPSVTLKAKDMNLGKAIKQIAKSCDMDYVVRDNLIFISSPKYLESIKDTYIFDTNDILVSKIVSQKSVTNRDFYKHRNKQTEYIESKIKAIEPETWKNKSNSIEIYDGVFFIKNNDDVIKKINELLDNFRKDIK